jgi:hypothetical protein
MRSMMRAYSIDLPQGRHDRQRLCSQAECRILFHDFRRK